MTPPGTSYRNASPAELAAAIRRGERAPLGRALSLLSSRRADHRRRARTLVHLLGRDAGRALRIALTGLPGAGKSSLIDALGLHLIEAGHRVAVLAVDPTSAISGGSLLGDKTRMERLGRRPEAFIRPMPTGDDLGGVGGLAFEAILLCEGAGFDVVIIETVGTGQSEIDAAALVDLLVLVTIAGAGDDLQGIKRGILELADVVLINKAEGDNRDRAAAARTELARALRLLRPDAPPPVLCTSAVEPGGVDELLRLIEEKRRRLRPGPMSRERARALILRALRQETLHRLEGQPGFAGALDQAVDELQKGQEGPRLLATRLFDTLCGGTHRVAQRGDRD